MSTRYIKKDNIVLVGVARNASQTIKQIALNNNTFEIREQQTMSWNEDSFIDFNDENLLILFPIRDIKERAISELLETARTYKLKPFIDDVVQNGFTPRLNYFDNDIIKTFIKEILFKENWKGCKIRFFDLHKMTTHLPKYLGWDIEIPYYNVSQDNKVKENIKKQFINRVKSFNNITFKIPSINYIFISAVKHSKYWIKL